MEAAPQPQKEPEPAPILGALALGWARAIVTPIPLKLEPVDKDTFI